MKIKRILVPIDFSKEAELALEWAVTLAKEQKDAVIVLMHVLSPIPLIPEAGVDNEKLIESEWQQAKKDLSTWQTKVPKKFKTDCICAEGDLIREVTSVCERKKIDLVVVTTHGRQGLSRLVHPNRTEQIVRMAPCPVLALHLNVKTEAMAA